jgi:hypothetical protein
LAHFSYFLADIIANKYQPKVLTTESKIYDEVNTIRSDKTDFKIVFYDE